MCFNFKSTKNRSECGRVKSRPPKYKIAEKDITVYKTLCDDNTPIYTNLFITDKKGKVTIEPYTRGFEYEELNFVKGTLVWQAGYTWKSVSKRFKGYYTIESNAFHTCKTREEAKKHWLLSGRKIVEMIIPKGAFYYENNEEYASNRIIYPRVEL